MTTASDLPQTRDASPDGEAPPPKGHRWWFAIPVALLAVGGLIYLNFFMELTRDFRWVGSVIVGG